MSDPRFPTTSWTLVLTARKSDDPDAAAIAFSRLCEKYWFPLYAYARRWGMAAEDAEDITQGFFAELIANTSLLRADPSMGRLRTYLITAFERDLLDHRKAANRQKRGGTHVIVSLDRLAAEERLAAEPATHASPTATFEREWAIQLLDAALARVEATYQSTGRGALFASLRPYLTQEADYEALQPRLAMAPPAIRQALHRLRERFARALRETVSDTLCAPTDADVDAEMDALREIMESISAGPQNA